ncbi:MAG TPA: trypsin-like peptidase domain-containing protein [Dehalococcoidia bacterium]|nr:trypsin-like peptidase domain-containing protein [Dehalococcoidia bacterium]
MTTTQSPATGILSALSDDLANVAEAVRRSVVEVRTANHGGGAGTIWRADGIILTNHHVAPRDRAEVRLPDGRELAASVFARDPENDIAALRVQASGLPALGRRDAATLRPGELVLAVGHPFGVRHAVSLGVLSAAPAPNGHERRELIRADVLLGPGNSGGPLVDARGRVVGLNAMVMGGLALAVPGHLAERLLGAGAPRPRLGVSIRDVVLSPAAAQAAGLAERRAALVGEIDPNGAAARAGVLPGDVLIALNGERLTSGEALLRALGNLSAGAAALRLLRGGVPHELRVAFDTAEPRAA